MIFVALQNNWQKENQAVGNIKTVGAISWNSDAQRIEQMVWILFLKVYDAKEEVWEFYDEKYTSIIPEELRWRNWAVDHKDGKALTGDALLNFVKAAAWKQYFQTKRPCYGK